jgi:hypothetical protein
VAVQNLGRQKRYAIHHKPTSSRRQRICHHKPTSSEAALLPPQTHVISTEGGAFAAVVERPLYFVVARLIELQFSLSGTTVEKSLIISAE